MSALKTHSDGLRAAVDLADRLDDFGGSALMEWNAHDTTKSSTQRLRQRRNEECYFMVHAISIKTQSTTN